MAASPTAPPALDGLLVLDFTRVIAGPYLTQLLGDLGARIIKIEARGTGDDIRHYRPLGWEEDAPSFIALNRNKKSVALDISTPEGRQACLDLARKADLLVENFRPDVMQRLGLDYPVISEINPGIVYCSISGYGHTSPYRMVPGYDPVAQAETGLMHLTGPPDIEPQKAGGSVADTFTSLHAGMGLMAALVSKLRTGRGQHVEVSLFDSMLSAQCFAGAIPLLTGEDAPRVGNASVVLMPVGTYECADGPIMIVVGNDRQFERFAREVIERPELAEDPRYATIRARLHSRDDLHPVLVEIFATRPRAYWVERMRAAGVPGGAVRTPKEAVESPEAAGRNMIWDATYAGRPVRVVGTPVRMSESSLVPAGVVPRLGEHTEEVLREELGYDDARIARLTG